jgi:MSHA biogenesis protein MshJ
VNTAYARLRVRYRKLARRERGLVLAAALVFVVGVGGALLVEPVARQRAHLLRQIDIQKSESESLRQRLGGTATDSNAAMRAQLAILKTQLRATDSEFHSLQNGLVQPRHMGALLESLLTEHRSLQLLGLRTLPVSGLSEPLAALPQKTSTASERSIGLAGTASAGTANDDAWVYRHAVEIRVQGSYADMLAYLQELETLPRRVYWGDLEIDARNYPTNVMTVTIFTVSLEKSWWVL